MFQKYHPKQALQFYTTFCILITINIVKFDKIISQAQSIGYQPNSNLGFNPYLSPVFGYGLGIPYGAYNYSPIKNPWFSQSMLGSTTFNNQHNYHGIPSIGIDEHGKPSFAGKLHAKSILKKFGQYTPFPYYYGSIKNKYNLMKQQQNYLTPYGLDYGYGKHYGAAMIPNHPYKSTYGEYYDNLITDNNKQYGSETSTINTKEHNKNNKEQLIQESIKTTDNNNNNLISDLPTAASNFDNNNNYYHQSITPSSTIAYHSSYNNNNHLPLNNYFEKDQNYHHGSLSLAESQKSYSLIKPLIKAGAILTTAAILGKKAILENPANIKLNPAGMILNSVHNSIHRF